MSGSSEEGTEKAARPMSQEERDAERRKVQEERQRRAVSHSSRCRAVTYSSQEKESTRHCVQVTPHHFQVTQHHFHMLAARPVDSYGDNTLLSPAAKPHHAV